MINDTDITTVIDGALEYQQYVLEHFFLVSKVNQTRYFKQSYHNLKK